MTTKITVQKQSLQLSENDAILLMQALEQLPKAHHKLQTASQNFLNQHQRHTN